MLFIKEFFLKIKLAFQALRVSINEQRRRRAAKFLEKQGLSTVKMVKTGDSFYLVDKDGVQWRLKRDSKK